MPFSGCSALCEVNSQLKKSFLKKGFCFRYFKKLYSSVRWNFVRYEVAIFLGGFDAMIYRTKFLAHGFPNAVSS